MIDKRYLQAGDLSEKITIYSTNEIGEDVLFAHAYAKVEDKNGLEDLEDRGVVSIATVEFTIRYMDNVDVTLEIEHQSQRYDIRNIQRIGRRKFLKLTTQIKE